MISKNDERLKTEASQADSNKKKAYALVNGIGRINKKQAEVAVKTAETPVQEAAQKTELELLATAKQRYFENLQELEKQEKVQRADEAVRSRQTLIWSQLDDPNCVELGDIKIENEGAVRAAAEKNVAKEFRHYRDIVDADFCAQCRFLKGEGYVKVPEVQGQDQQFLVDNDRPNISVSFEHVNDPKNRMERLRQEELSKVGESYAQRVAKMVPLLGSYVDYRYDPEASLGDFGKSLGIDAALLMMPVPGEGTIKAVGKAAKTAATVEKVANTVVKTAGKAEVKAVAGKTSVVKAETTMASQVANDVFLKNVQRNVLERGAGDAVNKAPYGPVNGKTKLAEVPGETVKSVQSLSNKAEQPKRIRKVGEAGTYKQMTEKGPFHDGMQAHHMPSQKWLKAHDIDTNKGFAAIMEEEQHIKTRTYGKRQNQLNVDTSYRSELAADLNDYINVLKADGTWTPEVRRSLMKGLDNFKSEFPDLFKKVNK